MAALASYWLIDFFSETAERNSTKLDKKQDLNVLYQVCVFPADRKNKMAALVSDWLRHFWLLLWNCWTEFNKTWQEERSQRPLPSLCFSGRSVKKIGCPGQSVKKVAHCTQVHDMWPFGPLVKKLNLGNNFWAKRDRPFIFHTCISCGKTFLLMQNFLTSWPYPWLLTYFWKNLTLTITFEPKVIGLYYYTYLFLVTRPFC